MAGGPAELAGATLHVAVDMQRMFAEETEWRVPDMDGVVPGIAALTRAHGAATVFTRFVTPANLEAASGQWRLYYRRWRSMVGDRLAPAMTELVAPLRALAPPAPVFDKTTYSAFGCEGFVAHLSRHSVRSIVLSGVETDVCVLATALDAVDRGLHVVIAADAVTSCSPAGHRAVLDAVLPRLDQQVRIASVADILADWPKD